MLKKDQLKTSYFVYITMTIDSVYRVLWQKILTPNQGRVYMIPDRVWSTIRNKFGTLFTWKCFQTILYLNKT